MNRSGRVSPMLARSLLAVGFAAGGGVPVSAAEPIPAVSARVNQRVVKLFGAGGFRGVNSYGSGVLVTADGHILTVANQLLDTSEIVVHLSDGRRMKAAVVATEPDLDMALLHIRVAGKKPGEPNGLALPFFDIPEAVKRPPAAPGDWVLASANSFEIAMRDEPVTVQRGVVAAVAKLAGRRGVFDVSFPGEVLIVDAITNNPGAAGGALTDRSGNLLGLVGRELKNSLTETWVNYAVPVRAVADVRDGDKVRKVSVTDFVAQGVAGAYKVARRAAVTAGPAGYHGITFVPNVLTRTPPYVEEVAPGSPADKAGVRANDLISFVDGEPVPSIRAFLDQVAKARPGTVLRLEVRRGDGLQTVELVLAEPVKVGK